MLTRKRVFAALALAALASGCTTAPITGRPQFMVVPDASINTMSLDAYRQVLSESTLSSNAAAVAQVRRVGNDLARATAQYMAGIGQPIAYDWEFNVIESDQVNAWCMPGGKIAVYTGILPVTQDDDGLAVVMGHEIAHALARHANERMSRALVIQMGGAALNVALRDRPAETRSVFARLYSAGTTLGAQLPHSRTQESEADRIGLILMASAGYDPRAAVPFWERMARAGGARPPQFLSTHPSPETRMAQLEGWLPEAMQYYNASARTR